MKKLLEWGLTTLVTAFVGSFIAGYLQQKAKNLATHEDINKLVDQTAALTQTTKEIEARISMGVWSQQQRWDVQKTALLESLKELASAENFLLRLVHTFSETKGQADGREERRREANEKYSEALNNFKRTQLATEIVCGRNIGIGFQRIDHMFIRMLNRAKKGDFSDIWDTQYRELQVAKRELGETIRGQLEFDAQLGGAIVASEQMIPQPDESSAAQGPD